MSNLTNRDIMAKIIQAVKQITPGGGGESNVIVVGYTEEQGVLTLDKTWAEINTAVRAGKQVIVFHEGTWQESETNYASFAEVWYCTSISSGHNADGDFHEVTLGTVSLSADGENSYPTVNMEG